MLRKLLIILTIASITSCKVDPKAVIPDVKSNLTFMATFNSNSFEKVSGTNGVIHKCKFGVDRNGVDLKAIYMSARDSAYIDFGDLEGTSFPDNIFTISLW